MDSNSIKLFIFLVSLIALWSLSSFLNITSLWFIFINLFALYIICKYKKLDKRNITIGIIFGILCMPSDIIMGTSVILPYIASMIIFKNSTTKIFLLKNGKNNNLLTTFTLVFVVGGILSGINVFFAISSITVNLSFNIKWIFDALRSGIFEEISFRLFLFSLCIYITKVKSFSILQNTLCYVIMILPHVLIHFNFQTFNIANVIMLSLLFGLPFTLMQRKYNLVSAIGSHSFVNLVRFCILNL